MTLLGTALRPAATRVMLLGAGELGKRWRLNANAWGSRLSPSIAILMLPPCMWLTVHVINMLDGEALRHVITEEKPHYIVPEIEAIATDTLRELEGEGLNVVPCARATQLTMNREGSVAWPQKN